ncbi:MAG: CRISPR-associated endonuclease Cas2 [Planctomycetaceae bacterium]|nr:CRISPR-associated endonuclease Cas2 [Planctomycetaceae bacterium]
MSVWIAAYDIADDKRRSRVASVLLRLGQRIQDSVFVLHLEPEDLPALRLELGAELARDDLFDLYPVDQRGHRSQWRWQRPIDEYNPVIDLD